MAQKESRSKMVGATGSRSMLWSPALFWQLLRPDVTLPNQQLFQTSTQYLLCAIYICMVNSTMFYFITISFNSPVSWQLQWVWRSVSVYQWYAVTQKSPDVLCHKWIWRAVNRTASDSSCYITLRLIYAIMRTLYLKFGCLGVPNQEGVFPDQEPNTRC